ncbi:MAG TPA: nucleoside hydrolase, partial [Bacteroidales bacterium]|nr:nucleoside hydrolase [Bacteroidales bacterium]
MKRVPFLLFLLLCFCSLNAHPWKPGHFIIIDTDGGVDDFRAISLLLASPDVRVLGITVTPGALSADETYTRVKSMLKQYFHEGIPVGINNSPEIKPANFAGAAAFDWGKDISGTNTPAPVALDVLKYIYKNSVDSIHLVCLGSLNIVTKAEKE